MQTAITFTGSVVSIDNLINPEFSFEGFLATFQYKNQVVRYCSIDSTRENRAINEYYYLKGYTDYINNIITVDELVEKHKFEHFEIINSSSGSEQINVFVKKLYLSGPNYEELFFTQMSRWNFMENEEIFLRDNKFNPFIKIPQRAVQQEPFPEYTAIPIVQSFYNKNKYLIQSPEFSGNEFGIAHMLNKICWMIQRICEEIFPLFSNDTVFNSYIARQIQEWTDDKIMDVPNYKVLSSYYDGVYDFFYSASLYRVNLNALKGEEKLHFLALVLGTKAISIIPLKDRMNILKLMISKHLSSTFKVEEEEQIVIRIVRSFAYNDEADRNLFLTKLVNPDFNGDGESGKTMYEVLYTRMSTAWEITRSSIELLNWSFNSTWKPTDTRGIFVKAVYGLWLRSEYNPYDYDTDLLKNNSIGFKKRINGVMNYRTNDIDDNSPPDYTTNKPSNIKHFYTDTLAYEIQTYSGNNELESGTYYKIIEKDASSLMFNYTSTKEFGFYIDNSSFAFHGDEIVVYHDVPTKLTVSYEHCEYNDFSGVYAGKYHIFQPVHLLSDTLETAEPMLITIGEDINFNGTNINSLVPVFFLKYIDDLGDSKDIQTFLGYAYDVVSTFIPVTNLAKLRHIRRLSWFGKVAVVVESVQITAGVLNFLLGFVDVCNVEGTFCKRLRTFLFYLELSSMATDAILIPKVKSSAKKVVEEGVENGWPSGMLDEIDGITPKQKIEELSGIDIVKYIDNYIEKSKGLLYKKVNTDPKNFQLYYSESQINELLSTAASKGLSNTDAAGIIHQACRKRVPEYIASIDELRVRMNEIILVRKRGYPYPFTSKTAFDHYVQTKIVPILDLFGIPKKNVRYGGSGLTSSTSFSPGAQDTDWWIFFESKQEELEFVKELEMRFYKYQEMQLINGKKRGNKIKRLYERYNEKGFIPKEYITAIIDDDRIVDWRALNEDGGDGWLDEFFGENATDISFKILGENEPIPSVIYKLD